MQNRLYLNGSPRLEKNERYPKIFASIGMFDNPHASESYVIEAILDSDFLKKIKMGIYQNNLKNNNFKYLKDLSISS